MNIIIGSAQFGLNYGIANKTGILNQSNIDEILSNSYLDGINTIDTAQGYGSSEKSIGNYLKKNSSQNWEIITKVNDLKCSLIESVAVSKKNLGNIKLNVLAHSLETYQIILKEIQLIKLDGHINKFGVSVYNQEQIEIILNDSIKPDIIQLPMNVLDTRLYKKGVLNDIKKENIDIHVRSVFLQGLFYLNTYVINKKFSSAVKLIEKLKLSALEMNLTLPQFSLLWLISLKNVDKIILGVDNWNQLKQHIDLIKSIDLSSLDFSEVLSHNFNNDNILNPSLW
jgi:aryl-alcohol dehydrogenase-like predicted oxidoreductase